MDEERRALEKQAEELASNTDDGMIKIYPSHFLLNLGIEPVKVFTYFQIIFCCKVASSFY